MAEQSPEESRQQSYGNREILVARGTKGLERFGGRISDEWLRRLEGERGKKAFREMADNDDTVGAVLFAIEMLLRNVQWRIQPYSDDPAHVEQAEFLESCMHDMDSTWEDFIAEILSMLTYGFAPFEIIYKKRVGPLESDKTMRSQHSDNRIGWRDISIRSQMSIDRWEFDEDGDLTGFWQIPVEYDGKHNQEVFIPMEKALLFRTTSRRGNPEGRSILRNAFISWFYKKRIQESEAIGIDRDLAGMPIFYVPKELFAPNAPTEVQAQLSTYRQAIENLRRDEQSGLVLPSHYDEHNNQLVKFELAGTGSRRLIDTDSIVRRHNRGIAQTVLADFIMLGQDATGSYALSADKTEMFSLAITAIMSSIAAIIKRNAVFRLYVLNGWNPAEAAEPIPLPIEKPDLEKFAKVMTDLTSSGWLTPGGEDDEKHIREILELPELQERDDDPETPRQGKPAGKPGAPGMGADLEDEDEEDDQ